MKDNYDSSDLFDLEWLRNEKYQNYRKRVTLLLTVKIKVIL